MNELSGLEFGMNLVILRRSKLTINPTKKEKVETESAYVVT